MGRTRDAFRRAGEWFAGEPGAKAVGRFFTGLLIVAIVAVILAIVYIGAANGIIAVREEDVGARLRLLVLLVLGSVAVAAAIAVVPPLIRSLWEQVGWWTNVFRFLALIVIVFAVWVSAPLVLPQLPGGEWFAWLERPEPRNGDDEPVGIIPDVPHALPSGIAAIRREAILQKYWRFLAHYGDDGLRRRYERVKQWRPLTERYATAAGLDVTRVESVMMTESAGQPENMSGAGAMGLMQLMPGNVQDHGLACGVAGATVETFRRNKHICRKAFIPEEHRIDMELLAREEREVCEEAFNPEKNTCGGVDQLRSLVNVKCRGDWENSLAAYNWGIGNLENAFNRMQKLHPGTVRSYWVLRDQMNDETRHYVPSVLAWEYIIRYMDAHDGTPPPHDGDREPPRVARRNGRSDDVSPARWESDNRSATPFVAPTPSPVPSSNVWYTVQRGEGIGDVLLLFREPTETIVELNADVVAEPSVAVGTKVRLPDTRYTFYRASGSESYRDIAARHGMPVADLLRWAGRWTAEEAILARHRDCPPDGCDDELAVASTGEQLLVRRQN
ncbi:MAG: transglycosylase SLT domain-containing protein [bacterium]|nr:transglycosylase SLT domain-containing protein [bacterium]